MKTNMLRSICKHESGEFMESVLKKKTKARREGFVEKAGMREWGNPVQFR